MSETLDSDPDPATGRTATFTLSSGQISNTHDAGFYRPATVGNLVWQDINGDGIRNGGEPGLAGVNVTLIRVSDNNVMGSDVTNGNGIYSISGLPPESYYLRFTAPSPYTFTLQNQGSDVLDSDPDSATGETEPFFLTSNQNDNTRDAGLYRFATVGNRVWEDKNGDGIQNDSEPAGVQGVTVNLYRTSDNAIIGTDLTEADGSYLIENVPPEQYYLVFTPPNPYTFTLPNRGGDDTQDSDANSIGRTTSFELDSDEDDDTWDAGLYRPITIGDRVWIDANGNGIQDAIETGGQANVTVTLYDSDDNQIDTTTTDANGLYSFGNLRPDQYYLEFTDLPVGDVLTQQNQGNDDTVDSDPDPLTARTETFTLSSNDTNNDWDAGITAPATVGDRVWRDFNADGIQDGFESIGVQNVAVTLYRDSDDSLVDTDTTDGNGNYSITNIPPGQYYLIFTRPNNNAFSPQDQGGNDTLDSDPLPTSGRTISFTLSTAEVNNDWDAGLYQSPSIDGVIWEDRNGDGINNDGSGTGIPGVTVILEHLIFADQTTTTDNNGQYTFNNFIPGQYTIRVDTATGPLPGMVPTNDPDNTPPDNETTAFFGSGTNNNNIDFGYATPVTIGDLVWEDTDGDGDSSGESGIANVTIDLELPDGTTDSTTTDGSGNYSFSGLNMLPGTYTVTLDTATLPQAGMLLTNDPSGTNPSDNIAIIQLESDYTNNINNVNNDVDFGYARPVTISGLVWEDISGDGTDNGGAESGLAGIPVELQHATRATQSTATDNNGNYSFTNLLPGTYDVVVDVSQLPVTATLPTYDDDGTDTPNNITVVSTSGDNLDYFNFGYRAGFCSNPNIGIPNNNSTGISDPLPIATNGEIVDMNVAISVTHDRVSDLIFTLDDGNESIRLIDRPGRPNTNNGCEESDFDVILDDEATQDVEDECSATPPPPAIGGILRPNESLSIFDDSLLDGTWTLTVADERGGPSGTLIEWCLLPTTNP